MIGQHPRQRAGASRRDLLRAGGTALLVTALPACDVLSTEPAGQSTERGEAARRGSEAPKLAERVRSEELPPVAHRLPKAPLVVEPIESVGSYGGTWRSWLQGLGTLYVLDTQIGYENLVSWDLEWTTIIPNVAESWEIRGDGEEYVFHLREGMKWSDGTPLTADDMVFTHDDVLLNPELYPVPPSLLTVGQRPATLEKIDDYTVSLVFPAPNGLFLDRLATPAGNGLPRPRHYLEKFHPKYNNLAAELARDEGFASWTDLFFAKVDWKSQNPDLPVLHACWLIQKWVMQKARPPVSAIRKVIQNSENMQWSRRVASIDNGSRERIESSFQGILALGRTVAVSAYHRFDVVADAGACREGLRRAG